MKQGYIQLDGERLYLLGWTSRKIFVRTESGELQIREVPLYRVVNQILNSRQEAS